MESNTLWETFYKSGKILDYIAYCNSLKNEVETNGEVHDRRVDNKGDTPGRK